MVNHTIHTLYLEVGRYLYSVQIIEHLHGSTEQRKDSVNSIVGKCISSALILQPNTYPVQRTSWPTRSLSLSRFFSFDPRERISLWKIIGHIDSLQPTGGRPTSQHYTILYGFRSLAKCCRGSTVRSPRRIGGPVLITIRSNTGGKCGDLHAHKSRGSTSIIRSA